MLEKITNDSVAGTMHFGSIAPDTTTDGRCFVCGGANRIARTGNPFIVLYLQDIDGNVIPGYIFNLADFKKAGLELKAVMQKIVQINYTENYHPRFGMSVILNKIEIINDAPVSEIGKYVGYAGEAVNLRDSLTKELSARLSANITIPYRICTDSYNEYYNGKIGGLCRFYADMYRALQPYANMFDTAEEEKQLYGTFLLYIYAHSNFLAADKEGNANVTLITQLVSHMEAYIQQLELNDGSIEVVHVLFGSQPTDIFVRLVVQTAESVTKAMKEINVYKTLPVLREGNAGYGTIIRYKSKHD